MSTSANAWHAAGTTRRCLQSPARTVLRAPAATLGLVAQSAPGTLRPAPGIELQPAGSRRGVAAGGRSQPGAIADIGLQLCLHQTGYRRRGHEFMPVLLTSAVGLERDTALTAGGVSTLPRERDEFSDGCGMTIIRSGAGTWKRRPPAVGAYFEQAKKKALCGRRRISAPGP